MEAEYYLVERKELIELIASQLKLLALENDGVDNWCGYGESFKDVIQSNVPDKFYDDPEISEEDKEMFNNGEANFYEVAAAMVKYEYRRVNDSNE